VISILCPTRNRPVELTRMVASALLTIAQLDRVEILFYVDEDDAVSIPAIEALERPSEFRVDYKVGPRQMLTQCWNELIPVAKGDLYMQGNDDIIFRTAAWDAMVHQTFEKVQDRILMVHGSDEGMHFGNFAAHPIVSKQWVDALGYFIPPYFSSDFGDKWVNDLANGIKRRVYLPFVVEHMHYMFGKAVKDQTTLERLERHERDKPEHRWNNTYGERLAAIAILKNLRSGPFSEIEAKALGTVETHKLPSVPARAA